MLVSVGLDKPGQVGRDEQSWTTDNWQIGLACLPEAGLGKPRQVGHDEKPCDTGYWQQGLASRGNQATTSNPGIQATAN